MDEFNMGMLRRSDPDVEEILGSSPHVTMYIMSVDAQKWERGNVEGTLFVLKRRSNPRFQLMVVNKLNTENYKETIESGFHAEVQPPYLIYTQGGGKVHALWFYEEPDLNKMAGLLMKVEAGLPKPPVPPPQPAQGEIANGDSNEEEGSFWDVPAKQEKVEQAAAAAAASGRLPPPQKAEPAPPPPPAPAPAATNAITNLFSKVQIQQKPAAPQVAPSAMSVDSAAALLAGPPSSAVPLPPSFFTGAQPAAAPAQAGPGPVPAAPSAVPPPLPEAWANRDAAGASTSTGALSAAQAQDAAGGSALSKLLRQMSAAPQAPVPGPAPAPPPTKPNKLTTLFTNAANKQQGASAVPGARPGASVAAPGTPVTPPRAAGDASKSDGSRLSYEDKLRLALARLVQRDEFITLLSEELRQAGLA